MGSRMGQRPFELVAIHAGPPSDWEEERKTLWAARMDVIRTNEHIARIEQSVYKRRWVPTNYEREFAEVFNWWLREKAEFYLEHMAGGGPISIEEWTSALWKDSRVRAAVEGVEDKPLADARSSNLSLGKRSKKKLSLTTKLPLRHATNSYAESSKFPVNAPVANLKARLLRLGRKRSGVDLIWRATSLAQVKRRPKKLTFRL